MKWIDRKTLINVIKYIFKGIGMMIIGTITVLGYLVVLFAKSQSSTDDDEKEQFMNRYDNHKGGIKVDNKSYSFDQTESNYVRGKFYDKYDKY